MHRLAIEFDTLSRDLRRERTLWQKGLEDLVEYGSQRYIDVVVVVVLLLLLLLARVVRLLGYASENRQPKLLYCI